MITPSVETFGEPSRLFVLEGEEKFSRPFGLLNFQMFNINLREKQNNPSNHISYDHIKYQKKL